MQNTGVHPEQVMRAIQRRVLDGSDAIVLVESGNAFGWGNRHLQAPEPGRYRASMTWGSLGHACAGVVAVALARGGKAVAVTGDGAMLYTNEVSTAVASRALAVWIVLNDAAYGSCIAGQRSRNFSDKGLKIPRVDFRAYARALGAAGANVETPAELDSHLDNAMSARGPYVLDVKITSAESPLGARFRSFFGSEGRSR